MTIDEISSATNTRPDMLLRVMRGLQGLGLVGVESDGRISVTEIGALLGSDAAGSLRHVALHGGRVNEETPLGGPLVPAIALPRYCASQTLTRSWFV